MKKLLPLFLLCTSAVASFAQINAPADISKIRTEALQHSKVMDIAFHLTDASGPRLTNSPGYMRAANYAKGELGNWGLVNAALEPWGEFGKSWELKKSYLAMNEPYYRPLIAFPKTWTKGTKGSKKAEVILVSAKDSAGLEQYRGRLKNKIVLREMKDTLKFSFKPDASRYDSARLAKMAEAKPADLSNRQGRPNRNDGPRQKSVAELLKEMAKEEGAVAVLSTSARGQDGTLFVQGGGAYGANDPENFLDIVIAFEDYMSLQRLVKSGMPVTLEADVKTDFFDKDLNGYNVVAEIPGTDLKDEWVMLGAHLDSWQGATGATDNAAGSAVMLEAIRILKTTGVPLRRSVRIALWSGEEQGLLGSSNYVKNHFGDRTTNVMKPDQQKISAYFNLDNGSGKIRGIYTQGNTAVVPIFTEWLQPFNDLEASTVTVSNTGGTDHLSFDRIGIPGFQFIQDELEYNTRTHHTNMDSYDHLSEPDLMQAAAIVAAFVYDAANRDEKLPRK